MAPDDMTSLKLNGVAATDAALTNLLGTTTQGPSRGSSSLGHATLEGAWDGEGSHDRLGLGTTGAVLRSDRVRGYMPNE